MIAGLLSLVAMIPGAGAFYAGVVKIVGAIARCRPCMIALAALALFIAGDVRGHHVERVRCDARIAADHKKAEAAAIKRDADTAAQLEAKYRPVIGQLEQQVKERDNQVTTYEKQILAGASAGRCQLGAGALQLRRPAR